MKEKRKGRLSAILVGGASHVGKSTLAERLAKATGWRAISTDGLARHPGRPWPDVRPQVAEYYERLSPETIYWFLKVHHENMWPRCTALLADAARSGERLVVEGSALRPEFVMDREPGEAVAVYLHADEGQLRQRILDGSRYDERDRRHRDLIEAFIKRSLQDNSEIVVAARERGLRTINVAEVAELEAFYEEIVFSLKGQSA